RPAERAPRLARPGDPRSRAEPADRHELRGALRLPGIHLDVPGHRPAGLRHHDDRLRAAALADRVEVAQALSQQLPQSWHLPRGLHGRDRKAAGEAAGAEMAAHRRLFLSARRHADRRVLAIRQTAEGCLGAGPGRAAVPGTGVSGQTVGRSRNSLAVTIPIPSAISAAMLTVTAGPSLTKPSP